MRRGHFTSSTSRLPRRKPQILCTCWLRRWRAWRGTPKLRTCVSGFNTQGSGRDRASGEPGGQGDVRSHSHAAPAAADAAACQARSVFEDRVGGAISDELWTTKSHEVREELRRVRAEMEPPEGRARPTRPRDYKSSNSRKCLRVVGYAESDRRLELQVRSRKSVADLH